MNRGRIEEKLFIHKILDIMFYTFINFKPCPLHELTHWKSNLRIYKKLYDKPLTPYVRLLASEHMSLDVKNELKAMD
ncbi:MAG: hypothetical protein K0S11_577 [Gammaproteobacteria bacterium]|jgi:hypothetical protein|nr:hypothetical protein [Gammaproteobacteria bacterium]